MDTQVDLFIMAPGGQFVVKKGVKPGSYDVAVNMDRRQLAVIPFSVTDKAGDATETDTGFNLPDGLAFDPAGATQLEDYQRRFAPGRSIAELAALAATVPPGTAPSPSLTGDRRHAVLVRGLMERISTNHRALLQRLRRQTGPLRFHGLRRRGVR